MKRIQFRLFAVFAILGVLMSSCIFLGPSIRGNGHVVEQVRTVATFDQIKVNRGMNVYITQGSPAKLVVIADDNLQEVIKTEVEGTVLHISVDENIRWAKEKKVMVTVEKIAGVEAGSGANIWSKNQLCSDNLKTRSSAGANLNLDLNVKSLSVECSSGANVYFSGLAGDATLKASSGANLKAQELKINQCKLISSSGGNVWATVIGSLEAKASSGGNVTYYGNPASIDIKSSSGGNIHPGRAK